jgi:choline dehydrogenase-like flavoprotein
MVSKTAADVVIAGTGIVGCLIAEQMLDAGQSVLMLEAGPRPFNFCICSDNSDAQSLLQRLDRYLRLRYPWLCSALRPHGYYSLAKSLTARESRRVGCRCPTEAGDPGST